MKISASILDVKEPKSEEVLKINNLDIDLIHLDVMDGVFVENKTYDYIDVCKIIQYVNRPIDVHLMVSDVKKYIDEYKNLSPEYITFHYEAVSDIGSVIRYIHSLGIKAGISIKPTTDILEIYDYLKFVDLILIMSVEPGRGGQSFMPDVITKIDYLSELKSSEEYVYLIEVDGGINDETIMYCKNADICVVGSFITKNDYKDSINRLKNLDS